MCTPHRKVFVFRKAGWDGIKRKLNALFEKIQEHSKQPPVNELWNTLKITMLDGMYVCMYVCMYVYIYSPDMGIQKYTVTMKIIVNSVKISSPIGTISNSEVVDLQ